MNQTREMMKQAATLLKTGQPELAAEVCSQLLKQAPAPAEMLYNLGLLHQENRFFDLALDYYQQALVEAPENVDTHYNAGNCCIHVGRFSLASDHFRAAIRLNPRFSRAYHNLGLLLREKGDWGEAADSFEKAIRIEPQQADYYNSLGLTFYKQGRLPDSLNSFKAALELTPEDPVTHYNLANVYRYSGQMQAAVAGLEKAIALDPDFQEAYHNLGEALSVLGRYAEAADKYRQAIRVKPNRPEPWNGLGNALVNLGQTGEARDCYKKAIWLNPDYAGAHTSLGTAYYADRQLDLAKKHHRRALDLDAGQAEAAFNLGLVYLLEGNLEKGWPGYEKRFDKRDWAANYPVRLDKPKWDGRPFEGQRLLVHDEQGLGDTLQFVRYLEMVKPLGGTVLFETRKPLQKLLANTRGVDQLLLRTGTRQPAADFDLYCPLLSLPGIFQTTLTSLPGRVPYIQADREMTDRWGRRVPGRGVKVGVVWSGNPTHFRGLHRSAALADFEGLLQTRGVHFYGFQKGPAAKEAARFADAGLIENLGTDFDDFSDTAAAMAHMDLVISIDTSVAHLAGAMGKPVWVLLAYAADWRWLMARGDSPWYPTMRLFRQQQKGDWRGVIKTVQTALDNMLKTF